MTFELPFYPYPTTIYDLPRELLIHIFTFCIPGDYSSFTTATKRPTPVLQPLSLAGVCHLWRTLITQTPHLWSYLHLKINTRGQVPFVRAWLARAQSTPLHISLYYDVEDTRAIYFVFEEVVGLMSEASSRWVELNIRVPDYFLFLLFGDCTSMSGAKLDVLRIHKANFVWENPVSCTPFRLLGGLPAPRTLSLQGMSLERVVVGWKNLTCVSAEGVELGECLKAFHLAPKLEECTFVNINPGHVNDEVGYPTSIITHPYVHTLRIENTLVGEALLRRLCLPSLQIFSYIPISNPFHGYSHPFAFTTPLSDFSTLESLVLRSRCMLQRLSVPAHVPAEAFARLFGTVRTIRELILDFGAVPPGSSVPREVLELLVPGMNANPSTSEMEGIPVGLLLELEALEVQTRVISFPWSTLPRLFSLSFSSSILGAQFDPLSLLPDSPTETSTQFRKLHRLHLKIGTSSLDANVNTYPEWPSFIDRSVLVDILQLREGGAEVKVSVSGRDWVADSLVFHGSGQGEVSYSQTGATERGVGSAHGYFDGVNGVRYVAHL
ncbi:hypothetical protein NLJ89_g640 [Agrocybe chaxingu]|uniref:F-box domain-containing protein n=1 Tax=Agrocybe chaxingu TaxID=84603 RepID=A0A9W8N1Q0_9AGAR|nr:hypothetical protein NLJ89_g640 [Agrocybe chaxingu]